MSISMPSRTGSGPNPDIPKASGDRAEIMNPWEKALALLSDEDKKQFNTASDAAPLSMLDVLKSVGFSDEAKSYRSRKPADLILL